MTKEELIYLIHNLDSEDKNGKIEGIFIDRYGAKISTDSIRVDMDGGRIIMAQLGTDYYEANQKNWNTELAFSKNHEEH